MILNELNQKEIINLNNGERLGIIAEADILVSENTGQILAFLMPEKKTPFKLFSESENIEIPWNSIRKIGNDMIIVELEDF